MSPYYDPAVSAGEITDYLDSLRLESIPSPSTATATTPKQSINPNTEDYQHYYPHHNTQEIVFASHLHGLFLCRLNGLFLCRLAVKPQDQDESDKQNDCGKR